MLQKIQQRGRSERLLFFIIVFVGMIMVLLIGSAVLSLTAINTAERALSLALIDTVTVSEFAALPDDNAYPAAVTVGADGIVYTGSYVTGAMWSISADGDVTEIEATRDAVGSVTGLAAVPDGSVLIVDQNDADPRTAGGVIKRLSPDGTISDFAMIGDERGFLSPDDITLDAQGRVYVSDRGRDEVWRFDADGTNGAAWWTPPTLEGITVYEPTGLAYDPLNDAIIITDPEANTIYRAPVAGGESELVYMHGQQQFPPGFDGVTVAPDGTIYAAALGQNGIVMLQDGELVYVAGNFRGASDVDAADGRRLYVTNFDQFSLVARPVRPQLPFALDVIMLGEETP